MSKQLTDQYTELGMNSLHCVFNLALSLRDIDKAAGNDEAQAHGKKRANIRLAQVQHALKEVEHAICNADVDSSD